MSYLVSFLKWLAHLLFFTFSRAAVIYVVENYYIYEQLIIRSNFWYDSIRIVKLLYWDGIIKNGELNHTKNEKVMEKTLLNKNLIGNK